MTAPRALLARLNPGQWPLALRVPMLVAALMISVSLLVTYQVLSRLVETQGRHLEQLSDAYLDGLSSALQPHVLREDVWEVYDALDRAAQRYRGLDILWTTVTDAGGRVIASSQPRRFPLLSLFDAGPAEDASWHSAERMQIRRDLAYQGRVIGAIHTAIRLEAQVRERWEVLWTLIATNSALTLLWATFGYVAVRRMLRPVGILSEHMRSGADGRATPIPEADLGRPHSEFGGLFRRYNTLLEAMRERERLLRHLAEEERLAALGRLASGMAHEINNPLGGMLNAVDALKRHGDRPEVRDTSTRLIEQGLIGIRDIVRSGLAGYRRRGEDRLLAPADLDDLALLIAPEIKRKGQRLAWHNSMSRAAAVPVSAVRDAALNLLLNASAATPAGRAVELRASLTGAGLEIEVCDEGPGLRPPLRAYINSGDAAAPPAGEGAGLGLWMVKRMVGESGGIVEADRAQGGGAVVRLRIPERMAGRTIGQELEHVA
ncbi:MAG: hypothetical protein OHK0024_06570 [Thalassobaculales bacterium]